MVIHEGHVVDSMELDELVRYFSQFKLHELKTFNRTSRLNFESVEFATTKRQAVDCLSQFFSMRNLNRMMQERTLKLNGL
jgi:hypothetical protein